MDRDSAFAKFVSEKPNFHGPTDGQLTSWAASEEVVRFIYENILRRDVVTLETGSGHTTVAFAIAGTNHTCITPYNAEVDRILKYCAVLGVSTNRVTFRVGSSDKVLASTDSVPSELDFVFIDGAHRFPFPCLDWHHTQSRLRVGGIVGIDDIEMPSVRILVDFLSNEDEWQEIKSFKKTKFYRRITSTPLIADWRGQKINRRPNWGKPMLALTPEQPSGLFSRIKTKIWTLRKAVMRRSGN